MYKVSVLKDKTVFRSSAIKITALGAMPLSF